MRDEAELGHRWHIFAVYIHINYVLKDKRDAWVGKFVAKAYSYDQYLTSVQRSASVLSVVRFTFSPQRATYNLNQARWGSLHSTQPTNHMRQQAQHLRWLIYHWC